MSDRGSNCVRSICQHDNFYHGNSLSEEIVSFLSPILACERLCKTCEPTWSPPLTVLFSYYITVGAEGVAPKHSVSGQRPLRYYCQVKSRSAVSRGIQLRNYRCHCPMELILVLCVIGSWHLWVIKEAGVTALCYVLMVNVVNSLQLVVVVNADYS